MPFAARDGFPLNLIHVRGEAAPVRGPVLLVTGPTGSGKTTTLYACLGQINLPDRKIITVEDPRITSYNVCYTKLLRNSW